jgi:hypothetical protein
VTTAAGPTMRELARAVPLAERDEKLQRVQLASHAALLRAVVSAGVGGGDWRSTSDCAARGLVVDDRTLRRWLQDDALVLPVAVRDRLIEFAWAFGVDVPASPEMVVMKTDAI